MAVKKETVHQLQSAYMEKYNAEQIRNRRRKKGLIRRLTVVGMIFVVLFGSMTVYHFNQRSLYHEKSEQHELLHKEYTQLKNEEQQLIEEINLLSDESYILDLARTNYFLTKEGELIFQVRDLD